MLIAISTLVLVLIGIGLKYRRRVGIHIPVMMAAFLIDLGLLLYIEWSRHALATFEEEIATPTHGGLLFFHVAVSLLTLILYIVQIVTGIQMAKGNRARTLLHKQVAYLFIICRVANYVTSFWIV